VGLIKLSYSINEYNKDLKKADRKRWLYPLVGAGLAGAAALYDPMLGAQAAVPFTLGGWYMGEHARANKINKSTFKMLGFEEKK
jgi:hypothetical protein